VKLFTAGFVSGTREKAGKEARAAQFEITDADIVPSSAWPPMPSTPTSPKSSLTRFLEALKPKRPTAAGAIQRAIVDIEPGGRP
jgi:hypothetical protein